jgi:hypothetical protein
MDWYTKEPAKTDAEIALFKRQIEVQLDEYEQALNDYRKFITDWRNRQRAKGFRRARVGT